MVSPTRTESLGWAGWALATTGQPAARAEAVSPPATEKANGKFDAPNTATGPIGTMNLSSLGRGNGWRSGKASTTRRSVHFPSRTSLANIRSWPVVRPSSPVNRATGRFDSDDPKGTISDSRAASLSAISSKNPAMTSGLAWRRTWAASAACLQAS